MEIAELEAEAKALELDRFSDQDAVRLGQILTEMAQARALPVVIDIRTPDRTLYHVALPGSTPVNAVWARRKSNVAFCFRASSLLVGLRHRAKGETLARQGLAEADHADHGGAVPVRVKGVGVVAVATVSGLPQVEDHKLAVQGIRALMG